jgi:hypothetical protein
MVDPEGPMTYGRILRRHKLYGDYLYFRPPPDGVIETWAPEHRLRLLTYVLAGDLRRFEREMLLPEVLQVIAEHVGIPAEKVAEVITIVLGDVTIRPEWQPEDMEPRTDSGDTIGSL